MGFRKNKSEAATNRVWHKFCSINKKVLLATGLPLECIENESLFIYFLTHGNYPDYNNFKISIDTMNENQIMHLKQSIDLYFQYGFSDPGLTIFDAEFKNALKNKYPKSFQ